MLFVHITSAYDSNCDVILTHHISSWSPYDVYCMHHIILWFVRWCLLCTSHQVMIPLWCLLYTSDQLMILKMMFIVYIASPCDSYYDVICTHYISLWFQKRCYVHTTHSYDSKDDVMCTRRTRVMIWVDFYSLHDIMVMVQETISCVHITSRLWFHRRFHAYTLHRACDWEMILFPNITA